MNKPVSACVKGSIVADSETSKAPAPPQVHDQVHNHVRYCGDERAGRKYSPSVTSANSLVFETSARSSRPMETKCIWRWGWVNYLFIISMRCLSCLAVEKGRLDNKDKYRDHVFGP